MKSNKSYTCKISGNNYKVEYLMEQLEIIEDLSWYIFNIHKKFPTSNWWFNQKKLYHQCRRFFPELNSKFIQNFIRYYYFFKKGQKLPKKQVKSSINIDYQSFNILINNSNVLTNFWLRFNFKNFPLFGKILKNKILDPSKVKLIKIFKKTKGLYCKLTYVEELPDFNLDNINPYIVGLDLNTKRIALSNNIFYKFKRLYHRKLEHKKNKRKLKNYTKDFVHKLTTQISKDLLSKGVEVLILEDLRTLRNSASRKLKTSKGKNLNYIINSIPWGIFSNFLKYKCLDRGIKIENINPAYTSKTCSNCNSKNTIRPKQEKFICNDCNFQLDADLNGSRNIEKFYKKSQWTTSESCPGLDLKII